MRAVWEWAVQILRVIEGACAVGAAVAAAFSAAPIFTQNVYCSGSSDGPQTCSHWYDLSNPMVAQIIGYDLLLVVVLAVGIASALLYAFTRENPWRLVLWGISVFAVLFSFFSGLSLGGYFLQPSIVLFVAAIFSLGIPAAPRGQAPGNSAA